MRRQIYAFVVRIWQKEVSHDKAQIIFCYFSTEMALDWCQKFISISYLENKLMDFDEILCMQYYD